MASPSVAIILINWNGYSHSKACLESLQHVNYDNMRTYVVDNASTDDSVAGLSRLFEGIELLSNHDNLGFAGGNNVAIQKAVEFGCDYILLLNNDTTVEPDFLRLLINRLEKENHIGAVQPQIRWMYDPDSIWSNGGAFNSWTGQTRSIDQNKIADKITSFRKPDWLTGCCICIPRKVIEAVGMLDEKYFAYYEDVDWSFRIIHHGYDIALEPGAIVYHEAGASSKNNKNNDEGVLSPKTHFLNIRNQIWIVRKYMNGLPFIIALSVSLSRAAFIMIYFLIRGRNKKFNAVLKGLKEGISG